jgi:hypothetical protein
MKASLLTTTALCIAALGFSHATTAAPVNAAPPYVPMAAELGAYNGYLLSTNITGSHIKNRANQDIGTVDNLVINPDTGRIRFAVLDVGGFLGIDTAKVVVPWGAIGLEKNKPGEAPTYIIDATKDRLEKAPKFDASKLSDLYARVNAQPIFDYYSITYFEDVPAPGQNKAKAPAPASAAASPAPAAGASPAAKH